MPLIIRYSARKDTRRHTFMKRFILLVVVCGLLVNNTSAQETGVSEARFARLARGVSLMNWFWRGPESLEDIDRYFSSDDFAFMRDLGLTHVRIPIHLGFVYDPGSPDLLNAERLAVLDRALTMVLAQNLAVIVDLHSVVDPTMTASTSPLENDPAFVDVFIAFWRSFAAHLSAFDPEMVFLEPVSEPVFQDDPDRWPPIQARLMAAIRENAPQHTLIATGALWSRIDTLIALEPLADPNIVYNFHFYEPYVFTHQGASWSSWRAVELLRDVPYPSSPQAVQPVIDHQSTPEAQDLLITYGAEAWDAGKIESRIQSVVAWAGTHNVRLLCSEFGVYKTFAPPADRVQWLSDVRTIFERYGIAWTMWEYDDSFGLVDRQPDSIQVDAHVARVLGLQP